MIATIIILCLMAADLGMAAIKHGELKEGKINFWITLFGAIVQLILFYYAGLFDKFIK